MSTAVALLGAAVTAAAVALTLASAACTVVPVRHGGAVVRRERLAAVVMVVSAVDMAVPAVQPVAPVVWGGLLAALALALLVVPRARPGTPERADLARHAGALLAMAGMWFAMTADASGPAIGGGHASHGGSGLFGLPFTAVVVVAALALAVAAPTPAAATMAHPPGRVRTPHTARWAAWRHPLMAVGMALMAVAMPLG
ncbi:hypothetical protein [Agromyces larvae]|uniref:DUF5134 domain-containing protein n=1 Tax=Agromyces larvae TaxID=2929802 RepID=A0ABY4BZ17_9MICO|nr:hypothetical protein [Agromyces larvae]UOE44403.1 hypothetical protein MTO99_01000 [Agromyces larvae]